MNETLTKIEFSNIEQFLEDINSNFAIVQNSPLYKGIAGKTIIGDQGPIGIRGSQFLFVTFNKFNTIFPGELTAASQIDITYINSKTINFTNKQKLLSCFNITEFVNNDIIVLTNSMMLNYDFNTSLFIDTKISFNGQANLLSSIETQIEDAITLKLNQNSTLNSTTNILENFSGYLTSLPQNSNLPIINLPTAVYEPYLNGTITGELLTTHKFFGFSETLFPNTYTGTTIFGSIRNYFNLIEGTIDNNNNLTSDYAPGVNNIPTVVFLQDTPNNCILFGIKGKLNLQSFGSIYKDSEGGSGNIVIKSDSGILPGDFSTLLINKIRAKFSKYVEIDDYLEINDNLIVGGNISSQYIRTNQYTTANTIEIGSYTVGSIQRNISENIQLVKFTNNVLVTDSTGRIFNTYSVENIALPINSDGLNLITNGFSIGNTTKKFITSNYLNWIYNKFNSVTSSIGNTNTNLSNYYTKSDFTLGNVTDIINHGLLQNWGSFWLGCTTIDQNGLHSLISGSIPLNLISIGNTTSISTIFGDVVLDKIKGKILVTDNGGKILNTYAFTDFTIPDLTLSNSLTIGTVSPIFSINNTTNDISIGNTTSTSTIFGDFVLDKIKGKILVTDINGKILNTYAFADFSIPDLTLSRSFIIGQSAILPIFLVDNTSNTINIGNTATNTIVLSDLSVLGKSTLHSVIATSLQVKGDVGIQGILGSLTSHSSITPIGSIISVSNGNIIGTGTNFTNYNIGDSIMIFYGSPHLGNIITILNDTNIVISDTTISLLSGPYSYSVITKPLTIGTNLIPIDNTISLGTQTNSWDKIFGSVANLEYITSSTIITDTINSPQINGCPVIDFQSVLHTSVPGNVTAIKAFGRTNGYVAYTSYNVDIVQDGYPNGDITVNFRSSISSEFSDPGNYLVIATTESTNFAYVTYGSNTFTISIRSINNNTVNSQYIKCSFIVLAN